MPTANISPVNVIAGQSTSIVPPGYADIGNPVRKAVIYNNTSLILTVQYSGGTSFLQPLTADVYDCSGIVTAPTVTPITSQAAGTYLGTITSTFYFTGDPDPVGFPLSLVQFPGERQVLAQLGPRNFTTIFAPPLGTNQIAIALNLASTGPVVVTVTGNQSGATYYNQTLPAGGSATFSILSNQDTTYKLVLAGAFLNPTIYALPGTVPTFPTSSSGRVTSSGTVIPSPSSGALYLFRCDAYFSSGAGGLSIGGNGTEIGLMTAFAGSGGQWGDHVEFNGMRISTAVTVTFGISGGIEILYAFGP